MKIIQATAVAVLAVQFLLAPLPERALPLAARPSLLEKQVAAYVGYHPQVLRQANQQGVVVVGLRVGKESRIARVTVYAQDEALRQCLVNRLQGKRLLGVKPSEAEQLVKLRFR
jgi:hypothetical protein